MRIEDLYREIVRQLEQRADVEIASKRIAKAKYFGAKINSYGLREPEERELIESYLGSFEQLSLDSRLQSAKMFHT